MAKDVTVDFDAVDGMLTLASSRVLLRISAHRDDLARLEAIDEADWTARKSIRAGTSLGHPVWWCLSESPDEVQVLVGRDDETWELALEIPRASISEILAAASP